jgi:hypothetical protein
LRSLKGKQVLAEYHRKYVKNQSRYVGFVEVCHKCGRKGYKWYRWQKNVKTDSSYPIMTMILHRRRVEGKQVNLGWCYLGVGKL